MFNKKLKNRIKELEHDRDVLQTKVEYLMLCRGDSKLGQIKSKRDGKCTNLYLGSVYMGHIRGWNYMQYIKPNRPVHLPKEFKSWEDYDYVISQIKLYAPYLF